MRALLPPSLSGVGALVAVVASLGFGCHSGRPVEQSSHRTEAAAPLAGTRWMLLTLDGKPVTVDESQQRPYIELSSEQETVNGHAGCNRFHGGWAGEPGGSKLSFGPLAATRMYCEDTTRLETEFLGALGSTTRYEISGRLLVLFADGRPLARLRPPDPASPEAAE